MNLSELKHTVRRPIPFWSFTYLYQPASIYLTWLCVRLGIQAQVVTLAWGSMLVVAAVCYALPWPVAWLGGACLVALAVVLDVVDGELSRYAVRVLQARQHRGKQFLDTCSHAAEKAVPLAIGLRLHNELNGPWWLLLLLVLGVFPGSVGPWQRYCEILIRRRKENFGDANPLPEAMYHCQTLVHPEPVAGKNEPARHVWWLSRLSRTLGSPDYLLTLIVATGADVIGLPAPEMLGLGASPYLLLWLATTSLHSAAAGAKSMVVYYRRLESLPA